MFVKRLPLFRFYSTAKVTPNISKIQNFWEHIGLKQTATGRQICIDGKPMKTPEGRTLEIPLTKPEALARLICQEWQVLSSLKLKSHMVPLTALAGRSIDIQPKEREEVMEKLLPYLDTDSLVILSPSKDCNGDLRKAQQALYPSMVKDACEVWGLPDNAIKTLDTEVSLFGNYQSDEVKEKVRDWMKSLDDWQFASLERATTAAKSLIVAMNITLNRRSVVELAMLSSLDVIHQTALWGEVEDTHDVDREDLHRLLGAAYINAMRSIAK